MSTGVIELHLVQDGDSTTLESDTYTTGSSVAVTISVDAPADVGHIRVWVDAVSKINTSDCTVRAGGVAFGGSKPKFDNVKIGYNNNPDFDIDDANDDVIWTGTFAGTTTTPATSSTTASIATSTTPGAA